MRLVVERHLYVVASRGDDNDADSRDADNNGGDNSEAHRAAHNGGSVNGVH